MDWPQGRLRKPSRLAQDPDGTEAPARVGVSTERGVPPLLRERRVAGAGPRRPHDAGREVLGPRPVLRLRGQVDDRGPRERAEGVQGRLRREQEDQFPELVGEPHQDIRGQEAAQHIRRAVVEEVPRRPSSSKGKGRMTGGRRRAGGRKLGSDQGKELIFQLNVEKNKRNLTLEMHFWA